MSTRWTMRGNCSRRPSRRRRRRARRARPRCRRRAALQPGAALLQRLDEFGRAGQLLQRPIGSDAIREKRVADAEREAAAFERVREQLRVGGIEAERVDALGPVAVAGRGASVSSAWPAGSDRAWFLVSPGVRCRPVGRGASHDRRLQSPDRKWPSSIAAAPTARGQFAACSRSATGVGPFITSRSREDAAHHRARGRRSPRSRCSARAAGARRARPRFAAIDSSPGG